MAVGNGIIPFFEGIICGFSNTCRIARDVLCIILYSFALIACFADFDTPIIGSNPFSDPNLELKFGTNNDNLKFSPVTSSTAFLTLPRKLYNSLAVFNSSRIICLFFTDALDVRRKKTSLKVLNVVLSSSVINSTIDELELSISCNFPKNPEKTYVPN